MAEVVYRRCSPCHRDGQTAPFSLVTYKEVRKHAIDLQKVIESRLMPPWLPEPGHGDFEGARRLTDRERELIRLWVGDGAERWDLRT